MGKLYKWEGYDKQTWLLLNAIDWVMSLIRFNRLWKIARFVLVMYIKAKGGLPLALFLRMTRLTYVILYGAIFFVVLEKSQRVNIITNQKIFCLLIML